MQPTSLLLVGAGGALGAMARYLVAVLVTARLGTSWPWATFLINVTGCFAIGFFMALFTDQIVAIHPHWRLFFPIGFVGAYTTFSTYEYETLLLIEQGRWLAAGAYVGGSTIAGFAAVLAAVWLARRF